MSDFTIEDIAAMRRDGSFAEFLRHQIVQRTAALPQQAEAPASPADPDHVPGAWPAGVSRPEPAPGPPIEAWQEALAEYRHWLDTGRCDRDYRCECPGCTARHLRPVPDPVNRPRRAA